MSSADGDRVLREVLAEGYDNLGPADAETIIRQVAAYGWRSPLPLGTMDCWWDVMEAASWISHDRRRAAKILAGEIVSEP